MTDNYDQIIADDAQAGQAAAVTNLDAKADDGAKAIRLSQDTGVPSMAIYNDLPNFQKQYKARLASQILLTHDELNGFVQSHPLAPVVANDDYGNLAKFTSGSKDTAGVVRWLNTYGEARVKAIKENDQFFGEGYGQQPYGSYLDEDLKGWPITKAIVGLGLLPFEMAFRAVGGEATVGMETAGTLAENVGNSLGLSESSSKLLGRDVRSELQRRMQTGEVPELPETSVRAGNVARARTVGGAPAAAEAIAKQQAMDVQVKRLTDIYQAGKQWYDQGLEPPRGVHPDIDASKAERNGIGVQELIDRLDQAQNSNMRQRAPGMFNGLAHDIYGDAEIGISGDRVAEIYNGFEPEANDGLLGFVPGIADKLALAREIGEDVGIPIKDWLTYVDPKIAAGLRDDIRMWPEGITAREASPVDVMVADTAEMGVSGGTAPIQYHPMVDSPLAAVRGAAGLEPMFSIGDRKLTLDRTGYPPKELAEQRGLDWTQLRPDERQRLVDEYASSGSRFSVEQGFHDFNLLDHNGNTAGFLNLSEQKGGKELHVDMISGVNGLGVRDFGPSLMIDLAKQIAAEFPEADTLTGHRVSGTRDKFGTYMEPHALVSIDLNRFRARMDVPQGWDRVGGMDDFRAILEGGEWQAFHPTVEGYVKAKFDPATQAINDAVREEFLKRVPGGQVQFVQRLRVGDRDTIRGVRLSNREGRSLVALATDVEDRMGVMHHEAIHALRHLFTDKEWMTLEQAARERDWLGKFDIEGRWGKHGLTNGKKLEESIAEGHRSWEAGQADVGPRLHPIFQKIKEFLDAIRKRINDILGRPGTVDDIFERVQSGEIGSREARLMREEEEFQASMPPTPANDPDILSSLKSGTYGDAVVKQKFAQYVDENTIVKDIAAWKKEPPGGTWIEAAKRASEGGKTSVAMSGSGNKFLFHDGKLVAEDLPYRRPQFMEGPSPPAIQDQINALKASSMGLTQKTLKDMIGLYEKRYQEDLSKAAARARRDETTRQTKEWRNNLSDMRKKVEGDLRRQPDIAADLFFSTGDLLGEKLPKTYRLATGDLSPEQQAALPKHYQAKAGLPPDQVASLFGYTSGDAMVEALTRYQEVKGGKSSLEALSQQVKDETSRRMEAKYGDLKSNILAEAHDLAHSETNQQILIAEYHTAAEMMKQPTVDMAMAKELAKEEFDKLQVGSMSSARLRATMAKHMRAVDAALAAQDYPTAMRAMQDRTYTGLLAAMAHEREAEIAKFQANAKRWGRREPPGIDPTWTNYLHQVLDQAGMRIGRSPVDLATELAGRKGGSLEDFVKKQTAMRLEVPVPDFLYDKAWRKEFGQLTNAEFEAINGATTALAHNGREQLKIYVADQARELSQVINTLNASLREFPQIAHDVEGKPLGRFANTMPAEFLRNFKANHFKLETLFDHWSRNDPEGSWYQYGLRDLINADYAVEAMRKDYAKKLAAAADKEDMSKLVKNDIWKEPKTDNLLTLNRGNLRAIMLNLGNGALKKSNLFKLASGYELKPQQIMDWVHSVADKKDWDFVQKIWDIFSELKVESDKMYRGLTGGVPSQSIPAVAVQTPFGTYKGGYYRIIHHKEFLKEKGEPKTTGLFEPDYTSATVPAGYMIERVVDTDRPLSLSLDAMPNALSQMIHDIGMRPAVINASKIFFNPKIQQTIFRHYGGEYRDLLEPYLRDVANAANYRSRYQEIGGEVSAFVRANAITTLVGLNIGTVLKHGPTAFVLSMKEVKGFLPALGEVKLGMYSQATRDLMSQSSEVGESLNDFIMRKSREIPHRDVNWIETMGGQTNELVPKGMAALRQQIIRYSSKPVAISDMLSAKPTWLAAYKQFMEENPLLVVDKTDEGAIDFADKAVRSAHGSTMQTAQAGIVRDSNRWLTGVYNFWSTIWQRQAEMAWQAGKTFDLVKEGDWPAVGQASKELGAQFFAYVIWPAIVEEIVSPFSNEEHESWGLKAVKGMARSLTASWVGVRDLANAVMYGTDPNIGLATTYAKSMYDLTRDLTKTGGPMSKDHAGLTLQHAITLWGMMTGMGPAAVGKGVRFLTDVSSGQQPQPKDPWAWLTGLRYGTLNKHSKSFDDWKKGLTQ